MDGVGHVGRRPRPVADAPVVDAASIAKGWLLALVADTPLAQAGGLPAAELARGGPALCSAVLAALGSDRELERLLGGDDDRLPLAASVPRLTGARTPAAVAAACELLRASAWQALRVALRDPVPEQVAELGDRLAYVCARVVAVALDGGVAEAPGRDGPLAEALASAPPAAAPPGDEPPPAALPVLPPEGVEPVDLPPRAPAGDPLSTLAEELAEAPPAGVGVDAPFVLSGETATVTRMRPVDTSWDERAEHAPPWLAAIQRRLERRAEDGLPFAVLVVEVDDLERLLGSQTGREVAFALETAERGLTAELAPADLVVRERLGRWWLTSPDRDGDGARDLGTRVAAAIGRAVLAGASLAVSIGVAVCPDDGEAVEDLAGHADQGMFAARAAGVPLA